MKCPAPFLAPQPGSALAGRGQCLLECASVGNWKQVQARIRKARTGADAPAKLEQLFLKTHDAMVAFELAKVHEAAQREPEAIEWYRKAHERFRRDEWRVKAVEAIQRLGGTPPDPSEVPPPDSSPVQAPEKHEPTAVPTPHQWAALPDRLFHQSEPRAHAEETFDTEAPEPGSAEETGIEPRSDAAPADVAGQSGSPAGGKRRRRGRRGGRRHRRGAPGETAPSKTAAAPSEEAPVAPPPPRPRTPPPSAPPAEPAHESGWVGARAEELRTRSGDPGLASRVARLEMQVRRLLACPPQKVTDSDLAPAGPGVLLLSDSDLTTHYHICACDTLRIEIGRMTRSDRGSRGRGREQGPSLRSRLADHLEISEAQAVKYLETHCVVRWLQLDEGAPRVAHFAIAALEPILND